jgi:type VI secretion system protein ImpJ
VPLTPLKHIPEPILWHEGMLLTPEHFDELTARQEELLQHHLSSQAFNWGVTHVELDAAQLAQGRVVLLQIEALMPDGFFLRADSEIDAQPSVDLESLDPAFKQTAWLLYLATPVQENKEGRRQRYLPAEPEESAQTALPAEEEEARLPIPRQRPRFQLIPSQTPLSSRFVSVPVACIGFRNGVWSAIENYLPPLLQVEETSILGQRCGALLRRVREFAHSAVARWRGMSARERAESRHDELHAIRSAVVTLPVCEAMLAAQAVHPFQLYLAFCSLAAHMAGVSEDPIPPVFSPYRHNDLLASFGEVERYIYGLLEEADTSRYASFQFVYAEDVFSLNFLPEWFGRPMVLALRGQRDNDPAVINWGQQALIGARSLQAGMRGRRVLGAHRKHIQEAHELFAGAGTVLFELQENREYLVPDELLEIATGPAAGQGGLPLSVTLYVLQNR